MSWNLLGCAAITNTLSSMILGNRVPHALLLTGADGSGKYSLARSLAQALNCEKQVSADNPAPCGQCLSCQKIFKNIHPDVKTIIPSGRSRQIKIDDIQTLREEVAFRPYEGQNKVFIIRRADRLNSDSGNAILKTLEEPPPDSILILTARTEGAVMPTMVSRCLRLALPPLPYETVLLATMEQRGLTGPKAELLAALAAGALGPALTVDENIAYEQWGKIDEVMGATQGPDRLEKAWALVDNWAKEEDFAPTLNLLRLWWRQTILIAGAAPTWEGPPPTLAQNLWAGRLTPIGIKRIGHALYTLDNSLARFVKAEMAFENFWLTALSL
ncbi:MAG: ATP-binding protein [Candidatus Adiutrix sp.]